MDRVIKIVLMSLQIRDVETKEVLLIKFRPAPDLDDVEKVNYDAFFDYLQNRNR